MLQATITLGKREFVLTELPRLKNEEWRKQLEGKLEPLIELISGLDTLEINTPEDAAKLVRSLRSVIVHSPSLLSGLIISYSPELQALEGWINENVYESELLSAIQEVIKLAYPLGGIMTLARQMNGLAQATINTTSKKPSGQHTRKKRGATR